MAIRLLVPIGLGVFWVVSITATTTAAEVVGANRIVIVSDDIRNRTTDVVHNSTSPDAGGAGSEGEGGSTDSKEATSGQGDATEPSAANEPNDEPRSKAEAKAEAKAAAKAAAAAKAKAKASARAKAKAEAKAKAKAKAKAEAKAKAKAEAKGKTKAKADSK